MGPRVQEWFGEWLPKHRFPVLVALAFLAAAIPTTYAVFASEINKSALWIRLVVIAVWVLAALGAAAVATGRDLRIERHFDQHAVESRQRVARVTEQVLDRLLAPGVFGIPECFAFTVYLYDPARNVLARECRETSKTPASRLSLRATGRQARRG